MRGFGQLLMIIKIFYASGDILVVDIQILGVEL